MAARPENRPLDAARETRAFGAAEDFRSGRGLVSAPQLSRELAAARQKLDEVLERDAALERQAVVLKQALSKTREFAYRDELTGLPNRRLLQDHFNHALARAARQGTQVAVLFLDLDRFKQINDTLGHAAGDALLQQVAARLSACIRASDTAARLGGDEFVVLLPELDSRRQAVIVAAKIRARLAVPYRVNERVIAMTVSIGMVVHPFDGADLVELLALADRAMYRDKARTCAPSEIASPVMHDAAL